MAPDLDRRRRSAIWRLMAIFALAFGLGAVAFMAGAYQLIEVKNDQRLTALIEADMEATLDKINGGDPEAVEGRATALVLARSARPGEPRRYGVFRDGKPVAGAEEPFSSHALRHALAPGLELVVDRRDGGLSVGREMTFVAILAAVFAALGAFVVGPLASRGLLARVEAINQACDQVRAGSLSARAPGAEVDDEFGALARHVNAMLERIDELILGLRDMSNRVAHDLRTPMARLKVDLELAARAGTLEEARERAALAAVETDEILQTFESLLDIAEAEAGSDAGFQPLDLAEAAQAAVDLYTDVAEHRGVTMTFVREPAPILGERLLLVRLSANLIDNAIKFSPPGTTLTVSTRVVGGQARLTVEDGGPGIPEVEQEQVLRRFTRGATGGDAPGHGLGLALVAAVAKRHGADLSLRNGEVGLSVTVDFPTFQLR